MRFFLYLCTDFYTMQKYAKMAVENGLAGNLYIRK